MEECLHSEHFRKALATLMTNYSKGVDFTPSLKEVFKPFDEIELDKIRIVVVYPHAVKELPEYKSKDILIVRTRLTESLSKCENEVDWQPFVKHLIDQISYRTNGTIFVFAGESTEEFSSVTRVGQFKFFVPDSKKAWNYKSLQENIDDLLKSINKEPILW